MCKIVLLGELDFMVNHLTRAIVEKHTLNCMYERNCNNIAAILITITTSIRLASYLDI